MAGAYCARVGFGAVNSLTELAIGGSAGPWAACGFTTDGDAMRVGAVTVRFTGGGAQGITSWSLDAEGPEVDGLPEATAAAPAAAATHTNTASLIDHVVVFTPSLDRTIEALAQRGVELRRERKAGTWERPVRAGFFRLGEVILEVLETPPEEGDEEAASAPAAFWGLVFVVDDLDAAAAQLGNRLGEPKDAVQPGRRIATIKHSAGLGVPTALITPHVREEETP
jgi:hypothetical protein